jgi:predicted nuclease of predicted toxin-antitoxin system
MNESLKFLVDVSVGMGVHNWLKQGGFDSVAVRDVDASMPDVDILAWAKREQRVVVTMDKDFGELVFHSGESHAGVLLLRLEDAKSDEKVRIVEEIITNYGDQLVDHFAVYQDGRLRIR